MLFLYETTESERTLKKSSLFIFIVSIFSILISSCIISCQSVDRQPEEVGLVTSSLSGSCAGSIATACVTNGTSESACNELSGIDCMWVDNSCVPETDCSSLDESLCGIAASSTSPIASCTWMPTSCSGSIQEACRVYGTSESVCNTLSEIDCIWVDGACVAETDCPALDQAQCERAVTVAAFCVWDSVCSGNIWNACQAQGTSETVCEGLSHIDCRWMDGTCLPENNCGGLDEAGCNVAAVGTYPIVSCMWGTPRAPESGMCSGASNQGGEQQCQTLLNQETCESSGFRDGNSWLLFSSSVCFWDGSVCHVKSTVCTDQTNAMLCYYLTPSSCGFGDCTWTPN